MERRIDIFLKQAVIIMLVPALWLFCAVKGYAGAYAVHVASFQIIQQAQADADRLRGLGYEAFIREANIPGRGKWYRVYAGKFNTRKQAATSAAQMKSKKQIENGFIHEIQDAKSPSSAQYNDVKTTTHPEKPAVVGNTQTKRYHLPGMPYYDKVKKHHRIIFQSEKQALDSGYYKAGTGRDMQRGKEKQNVPMKETLRKTELKPVEAKSGVSKDKLSRKEEVKSLMAGEKRIMAPPPAIKDVAEDGESGFPVMDEPDIADPPSDSQLYNKALGQLRAKQYEQALITFKAFLDRDDTTKEWGQRALRHMADCHYWLGKDGNKQELLIAAEFYRNTLASFPDPRKENAWTYYRLAQTYEQIKYYPEAVKQYRNLVTKYPESPYVPEASFKIGDLAYIDGKYVEAAESLIQHLMRFRGKANAKKAYYLVAHSFYKAKQSANAEIWFRDAQKKWPSLMNVPQEILLDMAVHKMSLRRYDEAIPALSFYANLHPDGEKIKEVLWLLAEAYRFHGQIAAALAVYNKMIEKYPGTKEAAQSRLKMAALGVESPGVKVFRGLSSIDNYRYPMDTYDDLIMKNVTGDIAEEAMLQKAAALVKSGHRRRAADVYLEFISLFSESARIADASRGLKSAAADLIDEFYAKKDYLAVAYVYFRSYGAVPLQPEEYPQISKIALSLKALTLMDDYSTLLTRYLKVVRDESISNRVSLDLSEGLILQGKYDEAESVLASLVNRASVKKSAMMTEIRKNLAEVAFRKEQYAQAVANYGVVVQSGQTIADPGMFYVHYAKSLKEQKDSDQALRNYLTAVDYLSADKREKGRVGMAYKEIGDLYVKSNKLGVGLSMYAKAADHATDDEMKRWSQFLVGRTYLSLDQSDQAQNIFAQIKTAAGPESFWGQVVDFYTTDILWWNKYGYLIQK